MVSQPLLAQRFSLPFTSTYDENAPFHVGIQYSLGTNNYRLRLHENWRKMPVHFGPNFHNNLDTLQSIKSGSGIDFSVGIPFIANISPNFGASFTPMFKFINTSSVIYTGTNPELPPVIRKMQHTDNGGDGANFNSFEFPLSIKFKSDEKILKNKFNRYRAYVMAGARMTRYIGIDNFYSIQREERDRESTSANPIYTQFLVLKPSHYAWEAGVGLDIYFTYFKMSPEIKFSQSFGSILDKRKPLSQNNTLMAPLEKAYLRNVNFSIIFQ